jgi:hypothetical protein
LEQHKLTLTPEQKLHQALRLYDAAKKLKAAALRKFHPNLSKEEIDKKVKEFFLHASS